MATDRSSASWVSLDDKGTPPPAAHKGKSKPTPLPAHQIPSNHSEASVGSNAESQLDSGLPVFAGGSEREREAIEITDDSAPALDASTHPRSNPNGSVSPSDTGDAAVRADRVISVDRDVPAATGVIVISDSEPEPELGSGASDRPGSGVGGSASPVPASPPASAAETASENEEEEAEQSASRKRKRATCSDSESEWEGESDEESEDGGRSQLHPNNSNGSANGPRQGRNGRGGQVWLSAKKEMTSKQATEARVLVNLKARTESRRLGTRVG